MERASEVDVKTPVVLGIGSFRTFAYMLISYIEGVSGNHIEDTQNVWFTLGNYARKIHAITSHGFGEKLSDLQSDTPETWSKYLRDNIAALSQNGVLVHQNILSAEQAQRLQNQFQDLQQTDLRFGLSHGDMSLSNVIVESNGVVNLIDWGSAESHIVPHYDFGVVLTDSLTESSEDFQDFLEGYGMTRSYFRSIEEQIKSLMLLIAVDKIRWALDRKPARLTSAIEHFHKIYEAN